MAGAEGQAQFPPPPLFYKLYGDAGKDVRCFAGTSFSAGLLLLCTPLKACAPSAPDATRPRALRLLLLLRLPSTGPTQCTACSTRRVQKLRFLGQQTSSEDDCLRLFAPPETPQSHHPILRGCPVACLSPCALLRRLGRRRSSGNRSSRRSVSTTLGQSPARS